ncbi:MAG: type II toxin-antitoxin system Phd/YefM family antitoxin [Caldilineales bacterium]|nr:type II toxin-antitoxin system Phd/YefM family antitoxin [Caldilineales bacterium]MCW5856912.1 type II toxin-antitoxin system Phd/YefM family antitoxin [Caldilineales bacterium]
MKIAPLAEVKDRFSAYIDESHESPIVVTRNGRPVAMLISIEDEDDLDGLLLVHNPRFLQLLEAARERVRVTGGISLAEFRRRLDAESAGQTAI